MIALIGAGFFWISSEYSELQQEAEFLRKNFIEEQKKRIQFEVNNALDYIKYNQDILERRLKNNIKERVYEAHSIAQNIYEKNKHKHSKQEIAALIKNALRPIRFNNKRGYYFAVDMKGEEKLYPVEPQFEGKNLFDLQDEKGNYVIQDEIEIIKKQGEGFVRNYWRKPGASEKMIYPKITFVKYFTALDWYFGTGEYLDDVRSDLQKESLKRISQIRFGEHGYIFVNTYDGKALITDGEIVQKDHNLWKLSDPKGNKVIQMEREAAEKPEGDYIEYFWPKMESDVPEKKISFIRGFPEWKWMLGAGFYVNEIEPEIEILRKNSDKEIKKNIFKIFMILILLTLIVFVMGRFSYYRLRKNVDIFLNFFRNAAHSSTLIDLEKLNFKEFVELAESANKMIDKRNQALKLLKESEEKYRLVLTNLGEGVVILDNTKKFIYANKAAEKIFACSLDVLEKKNLNDFKLETDEKEDNFNLITIRNNAGNIKHLFFTETKRFDENGKEMGTFAIFRDITERRKLEQERDENRDRIKLLNKILRHDLTNDFSVINSGLRLYQHSKDESMLEEIKKRVQKGLKTIKMIRKQESFLNRHRELTEVNLSEIVDDLKYQFPQVNIHLQKECSVFADDILYSVFENLTSNSIIHGKSKNIKIDCQTEGEFWKISFADDGKGIPDMIKDKIFDDGFIYGETGHTGIGLNIVKKTIERYEGKIYVKDNIPAGTIFEITLIKFIK